MIGNPQGKLQPTLWGLPVVSTQAISVGKFLTGAFQMGFDQWQSRIEVGLSITRFLKPGGVIALHDVEMVYHNWGRGGGGPRDIYRLYAGEKWHHEGSSNIGFLVYDKQEMLACCRAALEADWDTDVPESRVNEFRKVIIAHGIGGGKISKSLKRRIQRQRVDVLKPVISLQARSQPEPMNPQKNTGFCLT